MWVICRELSYINSDIFITLIHGTIPYVVAAFHESTSRTGNVFGSFFVQVDLGWVRSVSGVATQGLDDIDGNFVSQYKLNFSTDGSVWKSYMERPSSGSKVY